MSKSVEHRLVKAVAANRKLLDALTREIAEMSVAYQDALMAAIVADARERDFEAAVMNGWLDPEGASAGTVAQHRWACEVAEMANNEQIGIALYRDDLEQLHAACRVLLDAAERLLPVNDGEVPF